MMVLKAKLETHAALQLSLRKFLLICNGLGVIESLSDAVSRQRQRLNLRPCARQWPTGHRPRPPRGGHTPALARPARPTCALKRRAPTVHSTHMPLPSPARSASPQRCAELTEHHRRSATDVCCQRSSIGRFVLATAATLSHPPPRATSTTY